MSDKDRWMTVAAHEAEIASLVSINADLLAALKEMRQVAAATMGTIEQCGAVDQFIDRLHIMGIVNGFGVRADAAIAKAEGR